MLVETPNNTIRFVLDTIIALLFITILAVSGAAVPQLITLLVGVVIYDSYQLITFVVFLLGVLLYSASNPIHSLLCLISIVFFLAILFLVIGAEFLAFIQLIISIGAVAILFLFVSMLLNINELAQAHSKKSSRSRSALFLLTVISATISTKWLASAFDIWQNATLIAQTRGVLRDATPLTNYITTEFTDILTFSHTLYTYHSAIFILVSMLLLTAMLGAIVLATSTTENVIRRQTGYALILNVNDLAFRI